MENNNRHPSAVSPPLAQTSKSASQGIYITKLNGKNYNTWVFALECMLTDLDLWDVVTREADENDPEAKRRDSKARAKICLTCDESIYPIIRPAKSAFETFNCLKKAYADSFNPLVMALEHSKTKISSENVVAALLKEVSRGPPPSTQPVEPAALVTKQKRRFYCC